MFQRIKKKQDMSEKLF